MSAAESAAESGWSYFRTNRVLADVMDERITQTRKWGVQLHPDGTGGEDAAFVAKLLKGMCQAAGLRDGAGDTWLKILAEEVGEAFDETDPVALRKELVQCAAVAVAWIEAIDRRRNGARPVSTAPDNDPCPDCGTTGEYHQGDCVRCDSCGQIGPPWLPPPWHPWATIAPYAEHLRTHHAATGGES